MKSEMPVAIQMLRNISIIVSKWLLVSMIIKTVLTYREEINDQIRSK